MKSLVLFALLTVPSPQSPLQTFSSRQTEKPVVLAGNQSTNWHCSCKLKDDETEKVVGWWRKRINFQGSKLSGWGVKIEANIMCEHETEHVDCICDCSLIDK